MRNTAFYVTPYVADNLLTPLFMCVHTGTGASASAGAGAGAGVGASLAINYSPDTSMVPSTNALRDNRTLNSEDSSSAIGSNGGSGSGSGSSTASGNYLYSGGCGLVSTLADYAKFCNALLSTYHSSSSSKACIPSFTPEAARQMMTDQLPVYDSNGSKETFASLNWAKGTFSETAAEGCGFGFNMSCILNPDEYNAGLVFKAPHAQVGECGWGGVASTWFSLW